LINYRNFTRKELEAWVSEQGLPAYRGRQLFRWLWDPGFDSFGQATDFSKSLRQKFADTGLLAVPEATSVQKSRDGTCKFAWKLCDGEVVETVLIPERGHTTLCVSAQAGCAMGCRFCHTARMGFRRDLEPAEVAGQALAVMKHVPEAQWPRNIVFMGMGEPLANYDNLMKSLEILTDDLGLNFSLRRITVSTCGLVPEMLRLGHDADVGLAVSLHAPDNETRNRIMPINRRWDIGALIKACRDYPMSKRRRITFEYLLLKGINDSEEHAVMLGRLLRGIPAKINLIPFNESPGIPFKRSGDDQMEKFQNILRDMNYTVMMRKSKGRDISAACGQLYAEKHAAGSG
jgi:23S rRNA (adenine2503-C2)-methyltransferase